MNSRRFRFFLFFVVGAVFTQRAAVSHALEGRVIDGSNGKPVAGVYVIGAWQVNVGLPGRSNSGCSKLEVVRTDAEGKFALSTWSGSILAHLFGDENLNVYYYMRGYRWEKQFEAMGETVVIVPDTRPARQQLDRIGDLMGRADCGSLEQRKAEALPVYRLMYEEAQTMAHSYDERQSLSGMLFMVETLDLGEKPAEENSLLRFYRGYK
jgi:hypothetical protein